MANNPVHRLKKFVTYADGREPYWYKTEAVGWLSTGIKDRNGVEIFEGHKVKLWVDKDYAVEGTVVFSDSAFKIEEWLLTDIESLDIEVIGHVEEDEWEKRFCKT